MSNNRNKELIKLGILGLASLAVGAYLSKKENRQKIKNELLKTNESIKNKLDEFDYKYNIIPCNEVYEWSSEDDEMNITIHKKAKTFSVDNQE